jgi:hypothetical protein
MRKYVSLLNSPEVQQISSLLYFKDILEVEVIPSEVSEDHWNYILANLLEFERLWMSSKSKSISGKYSAD